MTVKIPAPAGSAHVGEASPQNDHADDQTVDEGPSCERVDLDRYVVLRDGHPVGYVEVVPPVMVCYGGHPYAQAVEIAQVHDFDRAIAVVAAHADSRRRPMITA